MTKFQATFSAKALTLTNYEQVVHAGRVETKYNANSNTCSANILQYLFLQWAEQKHACQSVISIKLLAILLKSHFGMSVLL